MSLCTAKLSMTTSTILKSAAASARGWPVMRRSILMLASSALSTAATSWASKTYKPPSNSSRSISQLRAVCVRLSVAMKEACLWQTIARNLKQPHWQRIESGSTARGIPDLNGCLDSQEIWIELKQESKPPSGFQVNWIAKRARAGGRVWLLTTKKRKAQLWGWLFLTPHSSLQVRSRLLESPTILHTAPFPWPLIQNQLFKQIVA